MTLTHSTIHWTPADQKPDADLSVLLCVDGLVEQGFWDGECWRWACNVEVEGTVGFWAQLPEGPK